MNTIFPHVEKKHLGGAKRKRDKFLVQVCTLQPKRLLELRVSNLYTHLQSCALEDDDMSTADQEKSLQSMWSLPRWKRKTANKKSVFAC